MNWQVASMKDMKMNLNTKKNKFKDRLMRTAINENTSTTTELSTDNSVVEEHDKLSVDPVLNQQDADDSMLIQNIHIENDVPKFETKQETLESLIKRKTIKLPKPENEPNEDVPETPVHTSYAEALSQAFVLTDHDLRKLIVEVEHAVARKDPNEVVWLQLQLQAKTLLLLKALDWKLWKTL